MSNSILVTGGAGYIGSHVVRQLVERGERVVVLDNLSTGYRSAVLGAPLVVGNTGDPETVDGMAIRRVADDERRTEHRGPIAGREIVEDHDALAALDELADDVAADVPGAAGDEDGGGHARNLNSRTSAGL